MLLSIHHVQITIPIGAEALARKFYAETLNLKEIDKTESLSGRGGFWLRVGDGELHIGAENHVNRWDTKAHLALKTDHFPELRLAIERFGIETRELPKLGPCSRFDCRDPFGNRLEFIEFDGR